MSQTRRGPAIRRLSVAVQVDGVYTAAADGSASYAPRGDDELAELAKLVRSAVGADDKRGDVVEIVSRRFVTAPASDAEPGFLERVTADDWWRVVELGTLALLTLAVLLFGVRPLVRRALPPPSAAAEPEAGLVSAEGAPLLAQAVAAVDDGSGESVSAVTRAMPGLLAQSYGVTQAQAALLEDVGQLIEHRTDDAVRVVRKWLNDTTG